MLVRGLDHINLRASRELMERLRDFYCEVVGLRQGPRPPFGSFGYWLYAGDQAVVHLSEAGAGSVMPQRPLGTYDHTAFACSDRTAFEAKLRNLGLDYRVAEVPLTGQVQLFLRDPAGNGVELNFMA
ncbi:MAG: diguanylate cyclase [Paucibacter sp.]|nr:diguanylate cyclase [Roseateles sp.]